MNIVLTLHQFLPDFCTGTELIVYYVAKELQNRGHQVTVVTGFPLRTAALPDPRVDQYVYDDLPVYRFYHTFDKQEGQTNAYETEYNHRAVYHWFKQFLKEKQPDVVHFFHLSRLSASVIDACVETGTPCMFTATDFWAICPTVQLRLMDGSMCSGPARDAHNCVAHMVEKTQPEATVKKFKRMPNWMLRIAVALIRRGWFRKRWFAGYVNAVVARPAYMQERFKKLERILVPSLLMKEMYEANGFESGQILHLPYGIPVEHIERSTNRVKEEILRVAFVGQIADHKGVHVLIEAMRKIPREVPIRLRLHGDLKQVPKYTEELRLQAGDDPRIEFAGYFSNRDIAAVLNDADVMVCPSIWYENTPLVIYEAMAAGVPVIASDLKGMSEAIKENVNGMLFKKGDSDSLAKILRELAGDRDRVARMSAHTVPPLSVAGHVSRLETIYREIAQTSEAMAQV